MPDPHEPGSVHEIVLNMNTGRYELRAFGADHPTMTAGTASEIAQMAADAQLDVRLVAGSPAGDDVIAAARDVDMKARGIEPPPAGRTAPGDMYELDRLAADLLAGAAVDATPEAQAQPGPHIPEPDLPTAETEAAAALAKANDEWLKAWQAEQKVRAQLDAQLDAGTPPHELDSELLLQLQIAGEALNAAEVKLAAEPGWDAALRALPPDDGPDAEAEAVAEPDPSPHRGPDAAALDEPVAEAHADASPSAEPAMPTEHVALDAPEASAAPRPGQVGSPEHAEAMAFAEAQLAPRGTPISELAQLDPDAHAGAASTAIISARVFPDAHAAAVPGARPSLPPAARAPQAKARLGKVLKRGRR